MEEDREEYVDLPTEDGVRLPRRKRREHGIKASDYIGSVVVNGALLFIANRIPGWNLSFITDAFPQALFALNLSLGAQVGGNLFLAFYRTKPIRSGILFLLDLASIYSARVLLRVFPFTFDSIPVPFLDKGVRIVLIVTIVASAISAAVRLVKFIAGCVRGGGSPFRDREDEAD
jgi:hypothetical protein